MANSIKGFGEIKGIYDDIGIGIKEIGDSMEEVDKSLSAKTKLNRKCMLTFLV